MTGPAGTGGSIFLLEPGLAAAAALRAADDLGVLARLRAGAANVREVAEQCRIGERGASLLLACLHVLGAADLREDGTYAAVAGTEVGMHMARLWNDLEQALRSDGPVLRADRADGAEVLYADLAPLLGVATAAAAREAADHLAAADLDVLDLGAGAAPWSLALAEREPTVRVTAVDLPGVLAATRSSVRERGLEERFTLVAGDLFDAPWTDASYDVVVLGNVLHLFDADKNVRLLQLAARALRPGGRVAIVDALLDEDGHGPRDVVLYSLSLLLRTRDGRAYPLSAIQGWLEAAGLSGVERTDLDGPAPLSLVTARKASC